MIEQVLDKLFQVENINRGDHEGEYLKRWHILHTRWFRIYLHKFTGPDRDPHPHDHPWNSWIFMLRGKYEEEFYEYEYVNIPGSIRLREEPVMVKKLDRSSPSFRSMKGESIHKIKNLLTPEVWTLFVCHKKKRCWGFHTPEGWVYWKDYLKNKTPV